MPELSELAEAIRELNSKQREWLALGLFYKLYQQCEKDKIVITKLLEDPLVARDFAANQFKAFLVEKIPLSY